MLSSGSVERYPDLRCAGVGADRAHFRWHLADWRVVFRHRTRPTTSFHPHGWTLSGSSGPGNGNTSCYCDVLERADAGCAVECAQVQLGSHAYPGLAFDRAFALSLLRVFG